MSVSSNEDDSWWTPIEQEVTPKTLRLRCHDIVFRMTQSLASKDYSAVLYAYTVRRPVVVSVAHRAVADSTVASATTDALLPEC